MYSGRNVVEMRWDSVIDYLNHILEPNKLQNDIKNMKCESELMSRLLTNQQVTKFLSSWLSKLYDKKETRKERKNLETSMSYKSEGNKKFQSKNYITSLKLYTKSAVYAPSGTIDLPVAIANRSASLFYLERWEDCIKDIELAIKLGYPEKSRGKLYLRIVECYLKLNKRIQAARIISQLNNSNQYDMTNEQRERLQKMNEVILQSINTIDEINDVNRTCNIANITESPSQPKLKRLKSGENPNFRSASASIEVKYAPAKGRYVIANRNIKKGETLFVEDAFTFVLVNNNKDITHCHNCCKSCLDIPVPCTECVDTLFCNMSCWDEACLSHHRWICPASQMGLLRQVGITHLALKLLCVCATTANKEKFNDVQQLVTNFNKLAPGDVISYGITAIMLTLYLSKYTDFFKDINLKECLASKFSNDEFNIKCDLVTEDDKLLYVSSLLLRHILQLICNGHAITKINVTADDHENKLLVEEQIRIATAIYPSASMMNHSCDPNIINSFLDQTLIVKAIKDIKEGEEVFHCYGVDFRRMLKADRQEILENQYCFTCNCKACTMSEYDNFMKRFTAIKCPECSGPLLLCDDHDPPMLCSDCGSTVFELTYIYKAKQAQVHAKNYFKETEYYIREGNLEAAIVELKKCLSLRKSVLYKYHEDIIITLDLMGKLYASIDQRLPAINHLEHTIVAIEERYGSCSIELCNELNKITDICITYLQEESNTASKFYKNILKKTRRYLNDAHQILDIVYGPWHEVYNEIETKMVILFNILQNFNV
ncbi:SET and MYND domain-containing protein 4 [Anoplolepis gracilipes]|uniref:SET and MYND domain-containing protein 4 n=1 Tax=Anoplolepis gracilipes TaxID=354296 RepID=UPI003B9F4555